MKPTFVTLDQYTKTHFETEIGILEDTEYPELVSHRKLHAELTRYMMDTAKAAALENDYDMVLNFSRKW